MTDPCKKNDDCRQKCFNKCVDIALIIGLTVALFSLSCIYLTGCTSVLKDVEKTAEDIVVVEEDVSKIEEDVKEL